MIWFQNRLPTARRKRTKKDCQERSFGVARLSKICAFRKKKKRKMHSTSDRESNQRKMIWRKWLLLFRFARRFTSTVNEDRTTLSRKKIIAKIDEIFVWHLFVSLVLSDTPAIIRGRRHSKNLLFFAYLRLCLISRREFGKEFQTSAGEEYRISIPYELRDRDHIPFDDFSEWTAPQTIEREQQKNVIKDQKTKRWNHTSRQSEQGNRNRSKLTLTAVVYSQLADLDRRPTAYGPLINQFLLRLSLESRNGWTEWITLEAIIVFFDTKMKSKKDETKQTKKHFENDSRQEKMSTHLNNVLLFSFHFWKLYLNLWKDENRFGWRRCEALSERVGHRRHGDVLRSEKMSKGTKSDLKTKIKLNAWRPTLASASTVDQESAHRSFDCSIVRSHKTKFNRFFFLRGQHAIQFFRSSVNFGLKKNWCNKTNAVNRVIEWSLVNDLFSFIVVVLCAHRPFLMFDRNKCPRSDEEISYFTRP